MPISCSRTSGCCAATSTAPATAYMRSGWKSAPATRRVRPASPRISPYHRYVLRTERKLFASPSLRAVICNSQMVKDEIRARFGLPEERLHVIHNAVDSDAFSPGLRALRGSVREAPCLRMRDGVPPRRLGLPAQGRGCRDRGDDLPAGQRTSWSSAATRRRSAIQAARPEARRRRARGARRAAGRAQAFLRRRRRVRAADALRSLPQCRARGDGVRPSGDHQHQIAAPPSSSTRASTRGLRAAAREATVDALASAMTLKLLYPISGGALPRPARRAPLTDERWSCRCTPRAAMTLVRSRRCLDRDPACRRVRTRPG